MVWAMLRILYGSAAETVWAGMPDVNNPIPAAAIRHEEKFMFFMRAILTAGAKETTFKT
jgi:hypothetical protein